MFELVIAAIIFGGGVLLGAGTYLVADLHAKRQRVKVLQETLENDWRLRQVAEAVKTPQGYDAFAASLSSKYPASQQMTYNGIPVHTTTDRTSSGIFTLS